MGFGVAVGVDVSICVVNIGVVASGADVQAARKSKTVMSDPVVKEVFIQISNLFLSILAPIGQL